MCFTAVGCGHKGLEVNTLAVLTRRTYSKECVKAPPRASRTRRRGTAEKIMDKIVFLCYYIYRNGEVENYGCYQLLG